MAIFGYEWPIHINSSILQFKSSIIAILWHLFDRYLLLHCLRSTRSERNLSRTGLGIILKLKIYFTLREHTVIQHFKYSISTILCQTLWHLFDRCLLAAHSEKIFRRLVWHHFSLKMYFGLREHIVILHIKRSCGIFSAGFFYIPFGSFSKNLSGTRWINFSTPRSHSNTRFQTFYLYNFVSNLVASFRQVPFLRWLHVIRGYPIYIWLS